MRWYVKWTAIILLLSVLLVAVYDNLSGLTKTVSASVMAEAKLPTIIIDAGHGGLTNTIKTLKMNAFRSIFVVLTNIFD